MELGKRNVLQVYVPHFGEAGWYLGVVYVDQKQYECIDYSGKKTTQRIIKV